MARKISARRAPRKTSFNNPSWRRKSNEDMDEERQHTAEVEATRVTGARFEELKKLYEGR